MLDVSIKVLAWTLVILAPFGVLFLVDVLKDRRERHRAGEILERFLNHYIEQEPWSPPSLRSPRLPLDPDVLEDPAATAIRILRDSRGIEGNLAVAGRVVHTLQVRRGREWVRVLAEEARCDGDEVLRAGDRFGRSRTGAARVPPDLEEQLGPSDPLAYTFILPLLGILRFVARILGIRRRS